MRRLRRQPRPEGGFTLLEVLVAIAILAVIGIASYKLLESTINTRDRASEHDQALVQLQKTMFAFQRDVEQTVPRPIRDELGDVQPAFYFPQANVVEFSRGGWRNPMSEPRSDIVRVRYALEDGHLRRYHWDVLDRVQDSKPHVVDLLDKVQDFHVQAMDAGGTWYQDWPPLTQAQKDPSQTPLPVAVAITFTVQPYGELRRVFRVVSMKANASTSTSTSSSSAQK